MLKRADAILTQLESQGQENPISINQRNVVNEQMSLFDEKEENPILAELAQVDVYNMTPMQAMNLLLEWKQKIISKNPLAKRSGFLGLIFSELIVG